MLQQQVYIINKILMFLDVLCIILAGYGGVFIRHSLSGSTWHIETDVFVTSVISAMVLNNIVMDKLALYSERRYQVGFELYKKIILAIFIDFGGLSAGGLPF